MRWRNLLWLAVLAACTDDTPKDTDTDVGATDDSDSDVVRDTDTDTGFFPVETGEPDTDTGEPPSETDTDTLACKPHEVRDCNGACFNPVIIGDDFCDDGPAPQADFSCAQFNEDGGDCQPSDDDTDGETDLPPDTGISDEPCGVPTEIRDCNGSCYPVTWLGDLNCDDGQVFPYGDPDFDCRAYSRDNGDCPEPVDTDIDTDLPADTDTDVVVIDTDTDTDVTPVDTDTDTDVTPVDTDTDTDVIVVPPDTDTDIVVIPPDTDTDVPVPAAAELGLPDTGI